jgi:hypothetical protein
MTFDRKQIVDETDVITVTGTVTAESTPIDGIILPTAIPEPQVDINGQSSAELISLAMDKSNLMPMFVEVANPGKVDALGAVIQSDAPAAIPFTSLAEANTPLIIDTTGYQSIVIQSLTAGIITPTTSNDQQNWLGMAGYTATAPQTQTTTCAAAGVHVFPVTGRFVKLTGPESLVQALVYLRRVPVVPLSTIGTVGTVTTVSQWAGTDIVNAGLAGVLSVGGNVATGVVPTTNPIQIGGVDAGRLNTAGALAEGLTPKTRRALVDEQGRFIPPNMDAGTCANYQGGMSACVKDTSQYEGQSQVELLAQILVELKTLNHQIHELPMSFNSGTQWQPADDTDNISSEYINYQSNH